MREDVTRVKASLLIRWCSTTCVTALDDNHNIHPWMFHCAKKPLVECMLFSWKTNNVKCFWFLWWKLKQMDKKTIDCWWCVIPDSQHITSIWHYNDVIMSVMTSQNTSLTIVYSSVYSDVDKKEHQISASLAFVPGIRWIPRTKGQLRGNILHLMTSSWFNPSVLTPEYSDRKWSMPRLRMPLSIALSGYQHPWY